MDSTKNSNSLFGVTFHHVEQFYYTFHIRESSKVTKDIYFLEVANRRHFDFVSKRFEDDSTRK